MSWSPRNTLFDEVIYRNLLNKTVPLIEHFSRGGQPRVCLDVGCASGEYTVMYAQYFDLVHAFDPRETIDNNPFVDWEKVAFHPVGVSNRSYETSFYNLLTCEGLSSFNLDTLLQQARAMRVSAYDNDIHCTTKQLISIDSLEITDVDFVKIDIEVGGHDALVGAVQTITENRPTIQIESNKDDLEDITEFLKNRKYTMVKNTETVFDRKLRELALLSIDTVFIPNERLQ